MSLDYWLPKLSFVPVLLLFFWMGFKIGIARITTSNPTSRSRARPMPPRIRMVYEELSSLLPEGHRLIPRMTLNDVVTTEGTNGPKNAVVDMILYDSLWKPYLGIVTDDSRMNGKKRDFRAVKNVLRAAGIPSVVVSTDGHEGLSTVAKIARKRANLLRDAEESA